MVQGKALIGICGAGAMGAGIAQVAAQAGHPVAVYDMAEPALERGRGLIASSLASLVKRATLTQAAADEIAARVTFSTDLTALADAELVVEAIVEDQAVKADLFAKLEAVLAPTAILASNTSSLSIGALAAKLQHPARFLGMHFFNPAAVMKLVEVIAGPASDPAAVQQVLDLAAAWGKRGVPVRDAPGFIVNRVARPFYAEGFRAWTEGVGEPAEIDAAMRTAGFRMGPLELTDFIGQDINFAAASSVYESYFGQGRFAPQLAQAALVAAGRLGRKSRAGVYDNPGAPAAPAFAEPKAPIETAVAEAASKALAADGEGRVGAVKLLHGDGRSATHAAAILGAPTAMLDWTKDIAAAATLVFTASNPAAAEAAAAFASALGKTALVLADRPGGLVLRTLCQLANAAADAVRDRIADAAGVDQAMVFGANYPQGPLAWAEAFGFARLVRALENLADETGEAMYRPSEVLRRGAWTGRVA